MSAIVTLAGKERGSNYYITRVKIGSQSVGDQTSWREDATLRNMSQRDWAPRPPVEQPRRTGKNAVMANRVGVNMLQFCSVSNSFSHTTLSIKWEVYFSKELCRSSLLCRRYDYACICIWVYNSRATYLGEAKKLNSETVLFGEWVTLGKKNFCFKLMKCLKKLREF